MPLLRCLALALLTPLPLLAETRIENGARFGAWTVTCEAVAVGETTCGLSQRLVRSDDNGFLAELVALWDRPVENRFLLASVPLGVHLPSGLALRPATGDEATRFEFAWQVCSTGSCEARLDLDATVLAALSAGTEAVLGYRPAAGAEPLVFRVAVDGLSEGMAALASALAAGR